MPEPLSFTLTTDEHGTQHIETKCPGRGCVKPYRIDEFHPDFKRILVALKRGDRSPLFCYHRARA